MIFQQTNKCKNLHVEFTLTKTDKSILSQCPLLVSSDNITNLDIFHLWFSCIFCVDQKGALVKNGLTSDDNGLTSDDNEPLINVLERLEKSCFSISANLIFSM